VADVIYFESAVSQPRVNSFRNGLFPAQTATHNRLKSVDTEY
jgi:hypothetical protein